MHKLWQNFIFFFKLNYFSLRSYWHKQQVIYKLNSEETFNKWWYFRQDLSFELKYQLKYQLDFKYLSLAKPSVAFKPSNLKIHRKNYFTGNNIQKHIQQNMHLYHEHELLLLSKSTTLNCENRIFLNFLLICHKIFFLGNSLILLLCICCALS